MKEKKPFWEKMEAYPLWRLMSYVFIFALSERLIVTLIFFLRWGFHAVSGIELWFYYGVAKGVFDLYFVWDPSWWILRALGSLFRGEALFYSVCLVASISSSLNAALFCLLVSKLHDKRTGFLAGLIYGSMVLPMFNSSATVTHDIFAFPYLILSLLGAVMFFKTKGPVKILFAGLCLLSIFIGTRIGFTILVGAGAIFIYLLWQAVQAIFGPRARDGYVTFALFLAVTIFVVVLLPLQVMQELKEKIFDLARETSGVDLRAQIKAYSRDLLSSSPGDYWLRFNFLLFYLPIGLWVAFKKKDVMCWGLVLVGLLASLAFDRGTRALSFGVAFSAALAFTNWRTVYSWILVAWMGFVVICFGGEYYLQYAVVFPIVAILIYCFIQWPSRKHLVYVAAVFWLFATIISSVNLAPQSTEGEYRLYRWLSEHVPPGGKILVYWSDGYFAEAVSGLPSELSPNRIDFDLPRFYWLKEEEAARAFRERGLEYIALSTNYFHLIGHDEETGDYDYIYSRKLDYRPTKLGIIKFDQLEQTALFKLLYRPHQLRKFRLLRAEKDQAVNATFLVYQILP